MQRIDGEQFGKFQEVGDAAGMFEVLIERLARAHDLDVIPENFAKSLNVLGGGFESTCRAGHADFFPHDLPEFPVNTVDRAEASDAEDL